MNAKRTRTSMTRISAALIVIGFAIHCEKSGTLTGPLVSTPVPATPTPRPPGANISGSWTGTFNSADYVDCDSNVAASADFQQNGSVVDGLLSAAINGCGFTNVEFHGTLQATALSGTVTGGQFSDGSTATGAISGANMNITLVNNGGLIPGGRMALASKK